MALKAELMKYQVTAGGIAPFSVIYLVRKIGYSHPFSYTSSSEN
jgi:hypothetical protein